MPSGPGVIDEEAIAEIIAAVSGQVETVLLTSKTSFDDIQSQINRCRPDVLQMVDAVDEGVVASLKQRFPEVDLIQVLHVTGPETLVQIESLSQAIDWVLLDSGNPALRVKQLGGTGRTHDWNLSRQIRESCEVPLWLAGGLNPQNIGEAVKTVRPDGVDVCSGVRSEGDLDIGKLTEFVRQVKTATQSFSNP